MTSAKRYPIVGVFIVRAESSKRPSKCAHPIFCVAVWITRGVRGGRDPHCDPPLPAPLRDLSMGGLTASSHCQPPLPAPTASPTATEPRARSALQQGGSGAKKLQKKSASVFKKVQVFSSLFLIACNGNRTRDLRLVSRLSYH